MDSVVKKGRFQAERGGQVKKTSLGEVGGSMSVCVNAKAFQDDLENLGFTPSLAKPEMGKEIGRRRARS